MISCKGLELLFFDAKPAALSLYEAIRQQLRKGGGDSVHVVIRERE